jgi:cyclase
MLRPRIIPFLLIKDKGLVKSEKFKNYKYVGDPINAVKIFNEKRADEIFIVDLDPTFKNCEPNYKLISDLAEECQMPMCYGGGIKNLEQAEKIFKLGVEKISISSNYFKNKNLVNEISEIVGSQSVVITLDVKKNFFGNYEVYINNGKIKVKENLIEIVKEIIQRGAGEIIINNIDRDGLMNGYDLDLIKLIISITTIPITIVGGAGNVTHFHEVLKKHSIIGLSAGSFFVFKGKFKAVLITYAKENILKHD